MEPESKPGSPRRGFLMMDSMASQLLGSKRSRDPESDTMLDNFHSHKRYLTEVMATSLNGLQVGEGSGKPPAGNSLSLADLIGSPTQADTASGSARDDLSNLDSAMSDDSDDSVSVWRVPDHISHPMFPQQSPVSSSDSARLSPCWKPTDRPAWTSGPNDGADMCACSPPSPGSPRRRPNPGPIPGTPTTPGAQTPHSQSHPFAIPARPHSYHHSKYLSPDAEGRLPPSPSDPSQTANLRRAALLRAFQARSQVSGGGGLASPPRALPTSPPHSHPHPTNLNPSLFAGVKSTPRSFFSVASQPTSLPSHPEDFPLSPAETDSRAPPAEGTASSFGSPPLIQEEDIQEEETPPDSNVDTDEHLVQPPDVQEGRMESCGAPYLGGISLGLQNRNSAFRQVADSQPHAAISTPEELLAARDSSDRVVVALYASERNLTTGIMLNRG
eukprot:TRINITY_DN1728_c0_g1_i1.p1 TRINITY_DN1728_c0_g1~~TRINITY_DN1728_c0_g1_i1.p1  ORF type:complete len:443 (+),score=51.13 TRINITY_DN1728_c0_g1_i1:125-1453(+)